MPKVWVYPAKTYEELGAERYKASWEQPKVVGEDIAHCYDCGEFFGGGMVNEE